jgi:hypothetical protein
VLKPESVPYREVESDGNQDEREEPKRVTPTIKKQRGSSGPSDREFRPRNARESEKPDDRCGKESKNKWN